MLDLNHLRLRFEPLKAFHFTSDQGDHVFTERLHEVVEWILGI